MNNCRLIERLLSAYVDGELNGMDMLRVRDHLRYCAGCRCEYDALVATKQALSRSPMHVPSADFEARLLMMVAEQGSKPPLSRWSIWWSELRSSLTSHSMRSRWVVASAGVATVFAWLLLANGGAGDTTVGVAAGVPILGSQSSVLNPSTRDQLPFSPGYFLLSDQPSIDQFQDSHATMHPDPYGQSSPLFRFDQAGSRETRRWPSEGGIIPR